MSSSSMSGTGPGGMAGTNAVHLEVVPYNNNYPLCVFPALPASVEEPAALDGNSTAPILDDSGFKTVTSDANMLDVPTVDTERVGIGSSDGKAVYAYPIYGYPQLLAHLMNSQKLPTAEPRRPIHGSPIEVNWLPKRIVRSGDKRGVTIQDPNSVEFGVETAFMVNPKQYHRILHRRIARAKLKATWKIPKRKPYLHQSRHEHAVNRKRSEGRFASNDKTSEDHIEIIEISPDVS